MSTTKNAPTPFERVVLERDAHSSYQSAAREKNEKQRDLEAAQRRLAGARVKFAEAGTTEAAELELREERNVQLAERIAARASALYDRAAEAYQAARVSDEVRVAAKEEEEATKAERKRHLESLNLRLDGLWTQIVAIKAEYAGLGVSGEQDLGRIFSDSAKKVLRSFDAGEVAQKIVSLLIHPNHPIAD